MRATCVPHTALKSHFVLIDMLDCLKVGLHQLESGHKLARNIPNLEKVTNLLIRDFEY